MDPVTLEEEAEKLFDLRELCRTCGTPDTNSCLLFEDSHDRRTISTEILHLLKILQFPITRDDGLPQQMCENCRETFSAIAEFYGKCKRIQEVFVSIKENLCLKQEKIEEIDSETVIEESWPVVEEDLPKKSTALEERPFDETKNEFNEIVGFEYEEFDLKYDGDSNIVSEDVTEETFEYTPSQLSGTCEHCKEDVTHLSHHLEICSYRTTKEICEYCLEEISNAAELETHISKKHSDRLCQSSSEQWQHIEASHENIENLCNICNERFDSEEALSDHRAMEHVPRVSQISNEIFETSHNPLTHWTEHDKISRQRYAKQLMQPDKIERKRVRKKIVHADVIRVEESPQKISEPQNSMPKLSYRYRFQPGEYACNICGASMTSYGGLRTHKRRHCDNDFICPKAGCQGRFRSEGQLKEHTATKHTDDEAIRTNFKFTCPICSQAFSGSHGLQIHVKTHQENRPYKCRLCGSEFKTSEHLIAHHNRKHLKEKKYACPMCDRRFVQNCELTQHLRIHSDEKPHECPHCPATYRWRNSLRAHLRTHTGEKPFTCLICGKGFRTCSVMNRHFVTHPVEEMKSAEEKFLGNFDRSEPANENDENLFESESKQLIGTVDDIINGFDEQQFFMELNS